MNFEIFKDSIDLAVMGITNSGKSTFIASLFDDNEFGEELYKSNDGGKTKVTVHYQLERCERVEVLKVEFNIEKILEGINSREELDKSFKSKELKELGLNGIKVDENDDLRTYLDLKLSGLEEKMKKDIKFALKCTESIAANKCMRFIKIKVPARKEVLEIMDKNEFKSITLRDTRGFLDLEADSIEERREYGLAEYGLDGIQGCLIMNGKDLVMPNIARDIYHNIVKGIFESVPTFIIERNDVLSFFLRSTEQIDEKKYDELSSQDAVYKANFKEMKKFLKAINILDDSGVDKNQFIVDNKRELILPEKTLQGDEAIYAKASLIVFDKIVDALTELRTFLIAVKGFIVENDNSQKLEELFRQIATEKVWHRVFNEFNNYVQDSNRLVKPHTTGYTKDIILNKLATGNSLLGPRGGITTRENGKYLYGHTGIMGVTAYEMINKLILELSDSIVLKEYIKDYFGRDTEKEFELCIKHIQKSFKYILFNTFCDRTSYFSGYLFVDRFIVVESVKKMRSKWLNYAKTNYDESSNLNTVFERGYFKKVENILENYNMNDKDKVKFSQLYDIFNNILSALFTTISNSKTDLNELEITDM